MDFPNEKGKRAIIFATDSKFSIIKYYIYICLFISLSAVWWISVCILFSNVADSIDENRWNNINMYTRVQ